MRGAPEGQGVSDGALQIVLAREHPMTQSRQSDIALAEPSDADGYVFRVDPAGWTPEGDRRWMVSCWRDGTWRGAVAADTLEEAALCAVRWHVTGEWPG